MKGRNFYKELRKAARLASSVREGIVDYNPNKIARAVESYDTSNDTDLMSELLDNIQGYKTR